MPADRPRFSIVMCVKNGMPYVREAAASLAAQTLDDFELVVQDAASTDGTAEFVRELPNADVRSEPDAGLGEAYDRAFGRCRGEVVGTLDADNLLLPATLETVAAAFREHRSAAAVYGAVQMIDAAAEPIRIFVPEPFELAALMRCELVPPMSTGFFHRRRCGPELRCDPGLTTMQDYDLWLRLSDLEIVRTTAVLGATRISAKSMSRDAGNYEHFCAEKLAVLDRFVSARPHLEPERDAAVAGIFCWAAEAILEIEGPGPRFESFVDRAAAVGADHERLEEVRGRAQG